MITVDGDNSENLAIKVDTDFGPFASLLLNSLLLSSLLKISSLHSNHEKRWSLTLELLRLVVGNRKSQTRCVTILPLVPINVQSKKGSE